MRRLLLLLTVLALVVGACGGADSPDGAAGSTTETATGIVATTAEPSTMAPITSPEPLEPAPWPTDGWPVAIPEEMGMSSGVLADLVDHAMTENRIDSITAVRSGHVVLDADFYPFPEATAHDLRSATKSVTATLVGIAIEEGLLTGVDAVVVELLADAAPAEVEASKAAMTVGDLLTMSSGLSCADSAMEESDDWAAHALARPMSAEPGSWFSYCNSDSHLLSAILSEVTGMAASEYADQVLFGPLGITDYVWPADPQGVSYGHSALMLRPADMAKLGYLYLRGGVWGGDQIVSAAWIEAATTAHISANFATEGYGYQWWVDDAGYFLAAGAHGQYIIVMPDHDLVVVFTARLPKISMVPVILTNEYVVPAILSDEPLPADPEAEARLAAAVATTGAGPEPQEVELAEMAALVDGVRYEYRPNDWGWEWFEIEFHSDTAVVREATTKGLIELAVGLDGRYRANDDLQVAVRGNWRNDNTFVVEFYVFGQVDQEIRQYSFEDGSVHVRGERDITSGGSAAAEAFPAS